MPKIDTSKSRSKRYEIKDDDEITDSQDIELVQDNEN